MDYDTFKRELLVSEPWRKVTRSQLRRYPYFCVIACANHYYTITIFSQ